MQTNQIDNTIRGAINHGQAIVVDGTHRSLRVLVASFARRLALRLDSWRALKRMPAATAPAMAMCPSYSALRRQRHQRWAVGVVATRGTVGVC